MLKPFTRNSASGFTILELIVATGLGLVVIGLTLGATLANRNIYQQDLLRTRLSQNIKSSLNYLGTNIREAGENLPQNFPAVEVVDGSPDDPDEIIVRRNLIDEVLKLCDDITAGSANNVYFAVPGTEPGCSYSDGEHNYNAFRDFRLEDDDESVRAFIYDPTTQLGEFFDYTDEEDNGVQYYLMRGSGTWTNAYEVGSTAIYLLEEWHFSLEEDFLEALLLQVIENGNIDEPMNIVWGLEDFEIQVDMEDGTTLDEFTRTDNWTRIQAIDLSLTGREEYAATGIEMVLTLSARFFPRNILSN